MGDVIAALQKIGLTEYEARVYVCLLNDHMNSATHLSIKSGVPRTRIYDVLESLAHKGWIKIYSGIPLLFRAIDPELVFAQAKNAYESFLKSIRIELSVKVSNMREKFIIQKYDIGLQILKDELIKARTVWMDNVTSDFLKKVSESLHKDAFVQIVLFPGEKRVEVPNATFKRADVEIVSMIKNQEVPSMSVVLDEERIFTVMQDPLSKNYIVNEMLYDECSKCFKEWYHLGWSTSKEL